VPFCPAHCNFTHCLRLHYYLWANKWWWWWWWSEVGLFLVVISVILCCFYVTKINWLIDWLISVYRYRIAVKYTRSFAELPSSTVCSYVFVGTTRLVGEVYGVTSCYGVPLCAVESVDVFIALVWHVDTAEQNTDIAHTPAAISSLFHRHRKWGSSEKWGPPPLTLSCCTTAIETKRCLGQNLLHQFPRSESTTSPLGLQVGPISITRTCREPGHEPGFLNNNNKNNKNDNYNNDVVVVISWWYSQHHHNVWCLEVMGTGI